MDVAARWNSSLAMLQRLSEQTSAIVALVNDLTLSKQSSSSIKVSKGAKIRHRYNQAPQGILLFI